MVIKIKDNKAWLSAVCILVVVAVITTVIRVTAPITEAEITSNSVQNINTPAYATVKIENMRGVWVPYMSLDTGEYTETSFKKNFDKIVQTALSNKMNTLVVHIRPFSDALYKSEIYPSSHILTGEQGASVEFDALEYMVEAAHNSNLKLHAWINPYRISTSETPPQLAQSSIVNSLEAEDILEYDGGRYINPSSDMGKKLIIDGVREVVKNYNIDGIQFDDYFYPTSNTAVDSEFYQDYLENLDSECVPLTQFEWRRANVNMLISSVYSCIKNIKKDVIFGVSPQCNITNCNEIGADVELWSNSYGYVDYICPQIYVNFEHATLPFDKSLKEWLEITKNKKVTLCIGLALYKANSDYDDGTWKNSDDILKSQIQLCKQNGIDNYMVYHIDYFNNNNTDKEVQNAMSVL
ncbi:MAG: family 10 glycosylhydrolase [Acutalibacteraceae bacterium]|nr:family 10 glycosylhydrolase [Acutalibacteraceae bacterium]